MDKKYALLGGGGMAIELFDLFKAEGKDLVGYYAPEKDDYLTEFLPWLGDERIQHRNDVYYIIATGLIPLRKSMIEFIENNNLMAGSFVSNRAYVSSLAKIGKGCVIFPGAQVTGNAVIGEYLFMDALSIIGHHDIIGDNVVVGPHSVITGACIIGNNVVLGANASLLPGTRLDDNVEIGLGTFPKKHVKEGRLVVGHAGKTLNY
ncbi:hypothetical protein [Schwartzia succinivorans]|jgi:UDP-3-O-[3-hydroxymyristoyl] glucosamine N-acyltransferase|uniref:hypothetical protein n=1 Tax=Schwartzia succinivorans TaxID=55507 RepID=UPI002352E7C3|nr:hypothetical protein [Schwartzia succinivorans]